MCPWGANAFRNIHAPAGRRCETNSTVVGSFREHINQNPGGNRMIVDVQLGTYLERQKYAHLPHPEFLEHQPQITRLRTVSMLVNTNAAFTILRGDTAKQLNLRPPMRPDEIRFSESSLPNGSRLPIYWHCRPLAIHIGSGFITLEVWFIVRVIHGENGAWYCEWEDRFPEFNYLGANALDQRMLCFTPQTLYVFNRVVGDQMA